MGSFQNPDSLSKLFKLVGRSVSWLLAQFGLSHKRAYGPPSVMATFSNKKIPLKSDKVVMRMGMSDEVVMHMRIPVWDYRKAYFSQL